MKKCMFVLSLMCLSQGIFAYPFLGCVDKAYGPEEYVTFAVVSERGLTESITDFVPAGECRPGNYSLEGLLRIQATLVELNHAPASPSVFCSVNVYHSNENMPLSVAFENTHVSFYPGPCVS